ncbi:MAG: amidohydrolase [Gemmatimonadetes bacterium]|nr:amidohydrolase [Gemmatimonadota bacterium]
MFMRISTLGLVTFLLGLCSACEAQYSGPPADLVVMNANVVTIDSENPRAEAVAVIGEKIIAVKSNSAIEAYIGDNTEVMDAEGRLMIPGFNDAHAHYGPLDPEYVELRYITDKNVITERVRERVAQVQPGVLIRGGHWEHEMFDDKQWPTKELLDEVAPNNPVALSRADGHSTLVNSYVLRASGITNDTPDPFGGEIQRDPETGEATGIFKESATGLLRYNAVRVERTPEEQAALRAQGWDDMLEFTRSLGVTSIQHAGGGNAELYQRMMTEGRLTVRVDVDGRLTADPDRLGQYAELRDAYPPSGNWIRFGYLKGFIDGTLGSGTAMFFEPFEDEPDKRGLPQMTYEELEERIVASDAMGFQVGIHAIGTEANHWILNAYEKAQEVNGVRDSRHRSEHAQVLIDEDIPRFAELGVVASMQPTHCITDKRFAEKRIGLERSKGAYAWRRLLDAGVNIAFGTDYSVEPLPPLEGIYAAVTRKDRLGEEGDGWFPDQKLTPEEAIELYTLGSAYAQFMEDRKGMIKEGHLADMVLYDRDFMTGPEEEIMQALVDYTIVGGKVVFTRQ